MSLLFALGKVHAADVLEWQQLAPLPNPVGLAGPFAGVSGGSLLVAGGANFPEGRPWEGAQKVWHRTIFVLDQPNGPWRTAEEVLSRPLAYGVSLTTSRGILCLGGSDSTNHYDTVFLLRALDGSIVIEPLPNLPHPVANHCGVLLGDIVIVAGGLASPQANQTLKNFWTLDLASPDPRWEELDPWPGPPRMLAVAAVQDDSFLLLSGTDLVAESDGSVRREYLRDAYRYTLGKGWKQIADLPRSCVAAPSPAFAVGQAHVLVVGGDDGTQAAQSLELKDRHSGFSDEVLAYHTITDTWTSMGRFPKELGLDPVNRPEQGTWPAVTVPTVEWDGLFIVPSGEVRPGVRSPTVWAARPIQQEAKFGSVNFGVLSCYLAAMVAVGIYWVRRNKNTNDFFRGGQRLPWWVAGLSIYATMLSSLTYMSVPAKAFASNWEYLLGYPFILITAGLVVRFVLPCFRRIDATSAYEYLERRFNRLTRQIGSALFVLFQIGRMAIVMSLSALALNAITQLSVTQCILLMGVLSIIYSALGGVEAVAWTDAIQSVVLLFGAILSLGIILSHVDGGLAGVVSVGAAADKFHMVNWDWGLASHTTAAFWVIALGGLGQNMVSYSSDQAVVQRYMTTSSEKLAARSIWTNGWLALPTGLLFFLLGTSLFAFYQAHPDRLDPTFRTDAIFSLFIVRELPAGLAGLVVAGIFAAAQSTVSTSMNSIASAVVTDFVRPALRGADEKTMLSLARWLTVGAGCAGTVLAVVFGSAEIRSLLDQFFRVLGLFGGALGGVFLLGMFTRRANASGAVIGMVLGAVVTFYVQTQTQTHAYLHAVVGLTTCMVSGWLLSHLFQK